MMNERTHPSGWILEYTYSLACAQKTSNVMKTLVDPQFVAKCGELRFKISGPFELNTIQSLVDLSDTTNYFLSLFIDKINNPGMIRNTQDNIAIWYENGSYHLRVYDLFAATIVYLYTYQMSEEIAHRIIYALEYSNINRKITINPGRQITDRQISLKAIRK